MCSSFYQNTKGRVVRVTDHLGLTPIAAFEHSALSPPYGPSDRLVPDYIGKNGIGQCSPESSDADTARAARNTDVLVDDSLIVVTSGDRLAERLRLAPPDA